MSEFTIVPVEEFRALLSTIVREELQSHFRDSKAPFDAIPDLLSRHQVAELFHVTVATIDNWANSGHLTKHRIGSVVRFEKEEVLTFLKSHQKYQRELM
ncbi:MAG: helix-turn-helix domain-containing protein [Saprospiraceae bacterium]|nr:helix-turn-helix domain-containing protein [Saprospiraceae bacterium]